MKIAIIAILILSACAYQEYDHTPTSLGNTTWADILTNATQFAEGFAFGALGTPAQDLTNCTTYTIDFISTVIKDVQKFTNSSGSGKIEALVEIFWASF